MLDEHQNKLKSCMLCGSSGHHGDTPPLCSLREANFQIAIVKDGVVGSHEYIA